MEGADSMSFQLMGLLCILASPFIVKKATELFRIQEINRPNSAALKTVAALFILGTSALLVGSYWKMETVSAYGTFHRAILITLMSIGFYFVVNRIMTRSETISKPHNFSDWLCFLITGLIAGGYCAVLSFKSFPISEGWYSVYAQYINNGLMPYKDFELLFMPLYTYIIALVTRIFGYDLIVLRIFGICIFVGMALLAYKMFRLLFSEWISIIAALLSVIYVQSEAPQIFYDYIRVFDLFAYASTYCLLSYTKQYFIGKQAANGWKTALWLILSGLFASLSFLTRQNSGAFVIAFGILLLCLVLFFERFNLASWKNLFAYIVSVILPIAFLFGYMHITGTLESFVRLTFTSALGAKGGLFAVLFNWIPRAFSNIQNRSAFAIFLVSTLLFGYTAYLKHEHTLDRNKNTDKAVGITFIIMTIACLLFSYFNLGTTAAFVQLKVDGLADVFYLAVVLTFIIEFVYLLFKKQNGKNRKWHMILLALSGMIVAIGYGCGTSGGLAEGQTGLALGLVIGLLLYFVNAHRRESFRLVALVMAFCITISAVSYKYTTAYSWWGLTEGDLRNATEPIDVEYMDGISVSPETKYGIESIVNAITDHSEEDDSIFAFPQVPIFYMLANRYPDTFTLVQWFDVANDDDVIADIEVLQQNLPKVIVHVHVDEGIIASHESLFRTEGESCGLRLMDEALTEMEKKHGYALATSFRLQNYPVEVWYLPKETVRQTVQQTPDEKPLTFPANFSMGDMSKVNGYGYSDEHYLLFPGAILGGPNIHLEAGEYEVVVTGENLDLLTPDIFSIKQGVIDELEIRHFADDNCTMRFSFKLASPCDDLEIRMLNWSKKLVIVNNIQLDIAD